MERRFGTNEDGPVIPVDSSVRIDCFNGTETLATKKLDNFGIK